MRLAIDVVAAVRLRGEGVAWSEIGRSLARAAGRSTPFTGDAVQRAISNWARGAQPKPTRLQVPAWVAEAGLSATFRDRARDLGEEGAASLCRRLKRDASDKPTAYA